MGKVLGWINNMPRFVLDGVSAVLMGSVNGDCGVGEARYEIFSGISVKADVAAGISCRDDFFLDQADFDMYSRIRVLCYLSFGIKCKLIDHN